MSKPIRFSRWRRLPGVHRITERKLPDHRSELQRLTLYLPGLTLDQAEQLAIREGITVQQYCEDLLRRVIEAEVARHRVERAEIAMGPLGSFDEITNDPAYLAEWSARSPRERVALDGAVAALPEPEEEPGPDVAPEPLPEEPEEELRLIPSDEEVPETPIEPAAVVLRHAGLGPEDAWAVLPTLRRGEPIPPDAAGELMQALIDLEKRLRDESRLDRRLCYALHRLAFEGQVLLTDAWPNLATDQGTVDVLRMIQESVDRILSGEDIRYYDRDPEPESPP